MGKPANFVIVQDCFIGEGPLIIKDIGPWDEHFTITNDAEGVVDKLVREGKLEPGQRLLYYDSEGELTELVIKNSRFAGFTYPPEAKSKK